MGIIYIVTNKVNQKIYIGKTEYPLDKRRRVHLYRAREGSSFRFHQALQKYGEDAFVWRVLDEASTKEDLAELETYYIDLFGAVHYPLGYNMSTGSSGGSLSESTKQKISKTRLEKKIGAGLKATAETKLKMSKSQSKRHQEAPISELTKQRITEALKGHEPWNKGKTGVQDYSKDHPYSESYLKKLKRKNKT